MSYSYVIISDSLDDIAETKAVAASFPDLSYTGYAQNFDEGIDLILELKPKIIFLEIEPVNKESDLSLRFISELHRYFDELPKIIVTAKSEDQALKALKYAVLDFFTTPFRSMELRKTVMRLAKDIPAAANEHQLESVSKAIVEDTEKIDEAAVVSQPILKNQETDKPLTICVKSHGDYRFIDASSICYLQADNNSTDIHLFNGELITAFKTLKQFENQLPAPFVRIHNSYIVNMDYVSRIHMGNAICYIKGTTLKVPFSKSYKENVDAILGTITSGNYLEF